MLLLAPLVVCLGDMAVGLHSVVIGGSGGGPRGLLYIFVNVFQCSLHH